MPSIEYGIDGYGRKVIAYEALKKRTYKCPYCLEDIHVRRGEIKDAYFAHNNKQGRTYQEMICPGYTGDLGNKAITSNVDKVYITNGGIPLYLCANSKERYQLDAYFPPLSEKNTELLTEWGTRVVINDNERIEEYSMNNIRHYQVKSINSWIKVSCRNLKYPILEVQQKWEWGIQGLNCNNDIFHSNLGGGYRVALHSNIVVDKEYLIITSEIITPMVNGVSFVRRGTIFLYKKDSTTYTKRYIVYAMTIIEVTNDSIAYIQKKGYQLIQASDDIIPMWPPAVIQGKELIFRHDTKKTFLFHKSNSEQSLFYLTEQYLMAIEESDNIFESETDNRVILLSDYQFNSYSNEIRFILTQNRDNFNNKEVFKPSVTWKDSEGVTKYLDINEEEIFGAEKLFFDVDGIDVDICILKLKYVESSSKRIVEYLKKNRTLVIDLKPYGLLFLEQKSHLKHVEMDKRINTNEIVQELYRSKSVLVPFPVAILETCDSISKYSKELRKILYSWKISKKIPYKAMKYLYYLKEVLDIE